MGNSEINSDGIKLMPHAILVHFFPGRSDAWFYVIVQATFQSTGMICDMECFMQHCLLINLYVIITNTTDAIVTVYKYSHLKGSVLQTIRA